MCIKKCCYREILVFLFLSKESWINLVLHCWTLTCSFCIRLYGKELYLTERPLKCSPKSSEPRWNKHVYFTYKRRHGIIWCLFFTHCWPSSTIWLSRLVRVDIYGITRYKQVSLYWVMIPLCNSLLVWFDLINLVKDLVYRKSSFMDRIW